MTIDCEAETRHGLQRALLGAAGRRGAVVAQLLNASSRGQAPDRDSVPLYKLNTSFDRDI